MKNLTLFLCIIIALSSCGGEGTYSNTPGDGSASSGQGGSMARFAIEGDYLYTVDNLTLKMFDISDASSPSYLPSKSQALQSGAETIFTLDTLLFIGSQTGMYVYNIKQAAFPQLLSHVQHITSCDPVVSDGKFAYVTLNSQNTVCGRGVNQLLVYDLSDISDIQLIHTLGNLYSPRGLGIMGDKLYVCDNGLKVFDISDPLNQKPVWVGDLSHITELRTVDAYDVIPLSDKNVILLIGADGFYQLDASGEQMSLISAIPVKTSND